MRDYVELIKALRCDELICANDDCPYYDNDHVLPCQVEILQGDAADAIEKLSRNLKDCRNELCLQCGAYKQRHMGVCNGCRWLDEPPKRDAE